MQLVAQAVIGKLVLVFQRVENNGTYSQNSSVGLIQFNSLPPFSGLRLSPARVECIIDIQGEYAYYSTHIVPKIRHYLPFASL